MSPSSTRDKSPAMKFVWLLGVLILLAVAGWIVFNAFSTQLIGMVSTPSISYGESRRAAQPDYASLAGWIARPDMANSPANDAPAGFDIPADPPVDVFFIHPTTYISRNAWNDTRDDMLTNVRTKEMVRHLASAFNGVGAIHAPAYRQATLGAFIARSTDSRQAFALAYQDVLAAFDVFLENRDPMRPFILAGHSQGAMLGLKLLKDRIAANPALKARLTAAYLVGWPISQSEDLAAIDIEMCSQPDHVGCVVSWQTFAEPADTSEVVEAYGWFESLSGRDPSGTAMVCINPLTGFADQRRDSRDNHQGALPFSIPGQPLGPLIAELVSAQCEADGFLHIAPVPGAPFQAFMLAGNNMHTYDIPLFWANLRENVALKAAASLPRATTTADSDEAQPQPRPAAGPEPAP